MVTKVVMPKLSLTMKEGVVGKWYKKEGENIEKGEPIVEIISEKATYDLEAPASGVLRRIVVAEGLSAPVDATIALLGEPDEPLPEIALAVQAPEEAEEEKKVLASPAAKRLAREHGIDLSTVAGSGPEGRVSEDDVARYIEQSRGVMPAVKEAIPLAGFRKVSAERVSTSFKTAPHSTVAMEVDFTEAAKLHEKHQVSYTAIFVKAAAKALADHRILNSTLTKDYKIRVYEDINIGVAVATEHGLVVPVLRKVDEKSLKQIDEALKELTGKARIGKLGREELTGGTFTITNLGMYNVDFFTPIINPPEAAILGIGRIAEKPMVRDRKIEIRATVTLTLSYDHRIIDGAPAATFLGKIKETVEKCHDFEN
ncbi:MAG: dihydrolipoamide acetyltransferase family protein [Candidatus Bathyarchaeota archaeon]|nr:dihydrolipoamide acetyltransferase family protein [Candidatus Bathyarchaeota archaeon]